MMCMHADLSLRLCLFIAGSVSSLLRQGVSEAQRSAATKLVAFLSACISDSLGCKESVNGRLPYLAPSGRCSCGGLLFAVLVHGLYDCFGIVSGQSRCSGTSLPLQVRRLVSLVLLQPCESADVVLSGAPSIQVR